MKLDDRKTPVPSSRLCVRAASGRRHGPVIFCYAGPEDPDQDNGEECKEGFEEAAINRAVGASADVYADDVLKDLADGETEACAC